MTAAEDERAPERATDLSFVCEEAQWGHLVRLQAEDWVEFEGVVAVRRTRPVFVSDEEVFEDQLRSLSELLCQDVEFFDVPKKDWPQE